MSDKSSDLHEKVVRKSLLSKQRNLYIEVVKIYILMTSLKQAEI